MMKLVEYKFEEPVSLYIDGTNLRKIVKIPSKNKDFKWSCIEIFNYVDEIDLFVNNFYVATFTCNNKNSGFLHFVKKIVLKYYNDTKQYAVLIYLNPPKW